MDLLTYEITVILQKKYVNPVNGAYSILAHTNETLGYVGLFLIFVVLLSILWFPN